MLVVNVPHDIVVPLTSNVPTRKLESSDVAAEPENIIPTESVCPKKCAVVGDSESVRLDISFKSPSHTGLQTTDLVTLHHKHILHSAFLKFPSQFVRVSVSEVIKILNTKRFRLL